MEDQAKHYVYKITNLKNSKIYIGVRTHPNPEEDKYMGSGTCIQKVIEIEGIENFKKEILSFHETREIAEEVEGKILTEEFCNNPETYNINSTNHCRGNKHCFRKDLWYDYYDEIRNRYKNGETLKELGKYYKCDGGTINIICSDIKRTISQSQQLRFIRIPTSGNRNIEFDKENLQKLLDLYNIDKWSVNRIATYFGKSCAVIDRRLKEANIIKRPRSENNEKIFEKDKPEIWNDYNKIINLYLSGKTLTELGELYKCDLMTIRQILCLYNIKIRSKRENVIVNKSEQVIKLYQLGNKITKITKIVKIPFNIVKEIINNVKN